MSDHECNVIEVFFGEGNGIKQAYSYRLKKPCTLMDIVLNDRNDCWDVIVYNRFFCDENGEIDSKEDDLLLW